MEWISPSANWPIIQKRNLFMGISGLFIIIGIGSLFVNGLRFGVDFAGGTDVHVQFSPDVTVTSSDLRRSLSQINLEQSVVQEFGGTERKEFLIRLDTTSLKHDRISGLIKTNLKQNFADAFVDLKFKDVEDAYATFTKRVDPSEIQRIIETIRTNELTLKSVAPYGKESDHEYVLHFKGISERIVTALESTFGANTFKIIRVEMVGPKVGDELRKNGIKAMVLALLAILIYVALRFEFKFAPGAILALIHDVMITVGVFSVFKLEFDLTILAACLTIIGYSINDTIVVYDRIRHNIKRFRRETLEIVINKSVNQTLSRTILTALATLFVTVSLYFFGGKIIQNFALALTVGIISGAYSTIFIASPISIWIHHWMERRNTIVKTA